LVYLYEIWEALRNRFNDGHSAMLSLNISLDDKDELKRLACSEPLIEGRHGGDHVGQLRKATRAELDAAHCIATDMIIKYFTCLQESAS